MASWAVCEDLSVKPLFSSNLSGATSLNSWATEHHACTPLDLLSEPGFKEVLDCRAATVATYDVLVCHNVGYDLGKVLAPMCRMQGLDGATLLDLPRVCTTKGALVSTVLDDKWLYLAELCNCLDVHFTVKHTADDDAKAFASCIATALTYLERGLAKELTKATERGRAQRG